MEKEKILDGLYMLKEAYEDVIFDFAQAVHSGEESLCDDNAAYYSQKLLSGFEKTLINIGMLEESSGSYAVYDEGSMRGGSMRGNGMRGGSRAEGSTRMQPRSRTTGRFRSYGDQPGGPNLKEMLQEKINRTPDPQTRMDMQRLMDSLADAI